MIALHPITRGFILMLIFGFVLTLDSSPLLAQSADNFRQPFASDRILVAFHPGTAAAEVRSAHSRAGGNVVKTIGALGVDVVAVPAGSVLNAIQQYRLNPNVKFVEPNYQRPLFRPVTNEGSEPILGILNNFNEQWGPHNTGQSFGATVDPISGALIVPAYTGVADADIDAPEGWALTIGNANTKIAILDSGVSCAHVDLDSKCLEQVNFVQAHGSPVDDIIGHGTHVAAIAAAETNNGIGTAGVAQQAKIGSLKVCYEDYSLEILGIIQGVCEDADIAAAIAYAADNGYHVINMSLAGPQNSVTLESAVNYAWGKNVVVVAAAGNDYKAERVYPAAYENVIAVAATDYYDNLAYFSNFSRASDDWVSVAAPGDVILSAVPGDQCGLPANDPQGCYDWKSGTSMAAPHVSGIAALLRSYLETPSNVQIRKHIEDGADKVGALGQNFLAWTKKGRVNLYKALISTPGGDMPVPGDYDGDGKSDIAVWRPSDGVWYVLPSNSPGTYTARQWGISTDIPVPGDYDADGRTDIAVWRSSSGIWYIMPSGSSGAYTTAFWGMSGDKPVSSDYDGDGKNDMAVWRPSTGIWYILLSGSPGSYIAKQWGLPTEVAISPLTGILRSLP